VQTPLHIAVLDGKNEALKMLLQAGVSLSALDESGQTPLALAKTMSNAAATLMLESEQGINLKLLIYASTHDIS
jgi:ankyrin repeat protein